MTRSLISSDNLGNLIDRCTNDLRNGLGTRLFDLASMMQSIAEANDDSVLFVLPQAIGGFANELLKSRSLITIPVLPEEIRKAQTSVVNIAVEQATKSLVVIKGQL